MTHDANSSRLYKENWDEAVVLLNRQDVLIAGLLAALEGVLRVADRKTDEFDAARAAIAKAKGATS